MIPQLNEWLAGKPDQFLTGILILISALAAWAAFFAPPAVKLLLAGWFVAP